ncbi:MAG: sensor histidine kinase [Acidimicrobiales bacterium]
MKPSGSAGHALRVAGAATLIVAVAYVLVVGIFDVVVVHRLVGGVDARLADRLRDAQRSALPTGGSTGSAYVPPPAHSDNDLESAPVFLWRVSSSGTVVGSDAGAPSLPAGVWSRQRGATTGTLGSGVFRFDSARFDGGWLVAGLSLAEERHTQGLLFAGEAIAAPIVLLGMFLGSLVIGMKASAPVEQARRRQLEFTADASHELRTPLSVIEAEVDVVLRNPRDGQEYRDALERVRGESRRLRNIVEDLLWLARFDATPPPPAREPIDVAAIARNCAERFDALARARHIELRVDTPDGAAWLQAPPEWIDRLAGVLVDNGCRYTPAGGQVRIVVEARGGRVGLAVEDSGPGVPPDQRARLFDRFHRSSDVPGGTGLGLAIADSVVRSTGGRWHVGDAALGGASFEVSWARAQGRAGRAPAGGDPVPTGAGSRPGTPAGVSPPGGAPS